MLDQSKLYRKTMLLKIYMLKRCSASLVIGRCKSGPLKYHFALTKIGIIKETVTSIGKDVVKLERSCIAGVNVKWTTALDNSQAVPEKFKYRIPI